MKSKLGYIEESAKVYEFAKIINKNNFSLGINSQIDDFVFINAGKMCVIGDFVHVSSFSSIIGGGEFSINNFSGISAGCRIITGSDDFSGSFLSNPTVPSKYKNVKCGKIKIGKHCILGSNSIVLPDIEIPDGVTIGAGSVVKKELKPWTIYAGFTPKKVGERSQDGIIELEYKLRKELGI
ncbi:MAG: acetyltransferase [Arcobacter sp.]|nr:acetyltransferase [Arcobacter sp.]|tara:strand:+ start:26620 stop:27162 length:543 start_codon:yes stop_codon:yes gene_type:complete